MQDPTLSQAPSARATPPARHAAPTARAEHIVEIVSDSGEGAQSAGQIFGAVCARMGNGVWTVEIIPAEIEPPARSKAGASGNRVRIGSAEVTNMGDTADVVIALNEQVLYSRIDVGAFADGTCIYLESKWAEDGDPVIRADYAAALEDFATRGYEVVEVPMERYCLEIVRDARRGKNMWVLGLLCGLYQCDLEVACQEVTRKFSRRGDEVVRANLALLESGHAWSIENARERFSISPREDAGPMLVMNGNQAVGLGAMAAGFEICSMYPITPATSASHYLASAFHEVGGFVHQAEDEIAAIGFAIGASYAGKTSLTITSGPGMALKTEFIGLCVMAEIPLVIVDVQRGGPSTGLPTRVEQSDLLAAIFGTPGDAPKIVLAASCIEDCFHLMVTARKLAETFRSPVIVLTDANLATGVQSLRRPEVREEWLSPAIDQSPWEPGVPPYDWDESTGLSVRAIPGQRGGEHTLTGLAHDEESHVAYEMAINQRAMEARSRKLATLGRALRPPRVRGDDAGDLLVVGWGSTRGAIEEAVDRLRADGLKVSHVHLRFLSPLEPGLTDLFSRFAKVMTVEINYSDDPSAGEARRPAQLAYHLRAKTLCDVGCWSVVPGVPLSPGSIERVLRDRIAGGAG